MATNSQPRIQLIDSLRGFALLGIFLVNITFFTTSLQTISFGVELWSGGYNEVLMTLRGIVIDGKFILIFSFLFGYGMVLLRESSQAKGRSFNRIYARRLTALLLIGLIHGILIWYGDVLTHYAFMGFLLMLFQRCKPKTLLIWSISLLLLVPVLLTGASLLNPASGQVFEPFSPADAHQMGVYFQERDAAIYGEGSTAQIMAQRLNDYISSIFNMVIFYPQILGMFLMGAYFCKRRILHEVQKNRKGIIRLVVIGGSLGLLLQLAMTLVDGLPSWGEAVVLFVGAPLLTMGYIGMFALLYQNNSCKKVLHVFSYPGKMAFTNYLLQSILCGLIFYSYGLGWYGTIEPVWQMLMAVVIFAVQAAFSRVWLKRLPIGPFEYVWRLFTYWGTPVKQRERVHVRS
ncbi:uncharacterized protein SAMN04488688_102767 [Paenibacillus sp. cl141a]|uniref:DUF418 domain-containing protein n=1 Tax=Paenibacillus sp. cl141a TaxID=1761877 RepID=UPI0008BE500F|nr:DUF418 domain-containing protein [Paenibacillus sp. cl141a]SEK96728.1 uncharacterized protein SAMN04488688_102767 [Paenibacillus sp. cl141a]